MHKMVLLDMATSHVKGDMETLIEDLSNVKMILQTLNKFEGLM